MVIKRLIAKEFTVEEDMLLPENRMNVGEKYTYLVDPETGRYYRPIDGWEVCANQGTDLADMFIEVAG